MGGDDRGLGDFKRIVERFVGNVGDVHDDAQAVQLTHHLLSKIGQAVVHRLVGGAVAPVVVDGVRQRHVAHAEFGVGAQDAQVVFDGMAAFEAHQQRDLSLAVGAADVAGGAGQQQVVGVALHLLIDGGDDLQGALDGAIVFVLARVHPDGEEGRVQPAFAHARNVDMAESVTGREVKTFVQQPHGCVDVRVDDNGAAVQLGDPWTDVVITHRRQRAEESQRNQKSCH